MVGVDALTQGTEEEMAMQCSSIQMPPDLTISKVLALFEDGICMGKKTLKLLSLGETATTFCSFFPSMPSKNTVIFSAPPAA